MHVLLVKTSSMGDVIHALPALTDAMRAIPGIRFDWVVEEAFQEIPAWHPAVDRIIPVALRRWRKAPLKALRSGEWGEFRKRLKARQYDLVLDSQGLIKSAWLAYQARGPRAGFDKVSVREPLASRFYDVGLKVDRNQHAITRQRALFAQALGYLITDSAPDSGLTLQWSPDQENPYVVFLHGTTWPSKEWPEQNWIELAKLARADGYEVKIPWGNASEKARAERIVSFGLGTLLPHLPLGAIAEKLAGASFVVSVDSGLAHLAAAIGVPAITLYGSTDNRLTGALGVRQTNLQHFISCSPCLGRNCRLKNDGMVQACWTELTPEAVWQRGCK